MYKRVDLILLYLTRIQDNTGTFTSRGRTQYEEGTKCSYDVTSSKIHILSPITHNLYGGILRLVH